ncbi:KilA-N domain-containing protein [Chromobacterium haemolyticum]|uniref:KilA-N domain-containing protein n=1 Tax=Chromobacterium fluminis TaxID=3044269 RepID=A0ABX0KY48_9NEIS|nr:KilA-N domain-containing protein [Chromobacterium haemolyticum]NHR04477.1 KilA-N domain-containing protein [Chromobacterium haemolyticum]
MKNRSVTVHGTVVAITTRHEQDYISLTDMVKRFGDESILYNWLRNRNTIEFLGIWEQINNPAFNPIEFERFKSQAGLNSFSLSPKKWIDATGAIGLYAKAGRGGGTYAHRDVAFEFGSWLSPEFKLYLIKEFQRLKDEEARATSLEWNFQRTLAKVNYRIHTDAIKERLIPPQLSRTQTVTVYASEADLLNVALFGTTAAQWRQANPGQSGNMRDTATLEQLVVLSNLESINAVLIHQGLPAQERLTQLNAIAITQMRSLVGLPAIKQLNQMQGQLPASQSTHQGEDENGQAN